MDYNPRERGRAFGLFYAFFSLGVIAGSLLVGTLDATPNQGFLTGALGIAAMAMALLVTGRRGTQRIEERDSAPASPRQSMRVSRDG